MEDCIIIKSKDDLKYFYILCKSILLDKYGIKRAAKFLNNKVCVKSKYNIIFSRIIAEYIVCEYIFGIVEELLVQNIIDVYESNELIVKIAYKLPECKLEDVIQKLKLKIYYFINKEKIINLDGLMIFCMREFEYNLFEAIEECLCDR